jgi:hypothetical protein
MEAIIIHRVATTAVMPLIAASGFAGYSYYDAPQAYPTQYPSQMVCTSIVHDLYFNSPSNQTEVLSLQRFFVARDYLRGGLTGVMDQPTMIAVQRFQADSGIPITGYLDAQTRVIIQQISCRSGGGYPYQNPVGQLASYAVDAPASLRVGQSGTWSVHVAGSNPYQGGGQLHYSVVWGDENSGVRSADSYYPSTSVVSSGSFTHVYNRPGTFTAVFTVRDDYGHSTQVSATTYVSASIGTPVPTPTGNYNYCTTSAGWYDRSCATTYQNPYQNQNPYQGGYGTRSYPPGCTNYYDRACYVNGTYIGPSYDGSATYNGPGDTCYSFNGQWQGNCGNMNTYNPYGSYNPYSSYTPSYGTNYSLDYQSPGTGSVDYSCYYDRACLARMNGRIY